MLFRVTLIVALAATSSLANGAERTIRFNRDIRPILADTCLVCHGPDPQQRKAELRLDTREGAMADLGGHRAIVPGKPAESELLRRILATDPDEHMPPAKTGKVLTAAQIELLRKWIAEGAEYEPHWAFAPPRRPDLPPVKQSGWVKNGIDPFVLDRLEREGLQPTPEADKPALIRRVTLDLTGLPPTLAEVDAFLADTRADAYEQLVDRLLASPRYGERMATHWLDAARYADTNGYNNDEERTMWRWREWVIDAFNRNLPYDQFAIEQLAGDLLPEPTVEQRVATGFNRNHVLTTEGGIFEEEYRVEYVADRVHTTATVFLGLSMGCARCHDHKYDPITQQDYYRFFAFFNNIRDATVGYNSNRLAEPFITVPTARDQAELAKLDAQRTKLEQQRIAIETAADAAVARWEAALSADARRQLGSFGLLFHLPLDETSGARAVDTVDSAQGGVVRGNAKWSEGKLGGALDFDGQTYVECGQLGALEATDKFSISAWVFPTAGAAVAILSKMDDAAAYRGYDLLIENGKLSSHMIHHWSDNAIKVVTKSPMSPSVWHHVLLTCDGSRKAAGVKIYVDGQPQLLDISSDSLKDTIKTDKPLHIGKRQASLPFVGKIDDVQIIGAELTAEDASRLAAGQSVAGLAKLLELPAKDRTAEQQSALRHYYLNNIDAGYRELTAELAKLAQQKAAIEKGAVPTMVMQELPQQRETFMLKRGEYDQRGERVSAGVPTALLPLPEGAPANRLGLARWLVQGEHPLTARVAVNRWWENYFGIGLVETVEDFGTQGALPSHPELLDWLATELVRTNWDVKAMQRLIVTSATYRQASRVTPTLLERDPRNVLLGRGARFRMPAEMLRDNALAISGLLRERIGGPSVKPYQPAGLWEDVSVERRAKYVADQGEGLYRRSMYTFWKRTCPPPGLTTFDAPDRETCVIRRARTNTPLQALVLMNDPTYVEAARKLAERALREAAPGDDARLAHLFRLAVARPPSAGEQRVLLALYRDTLAKYRQDSAAAGKLIAVGDTPRDAQLDAAELAAWTALASVILNLDETITKG